MAHSPTTNVVIMGLSAFKSANLVEHSTYLGQLLKVSGNFSRAISNRNFFSERSIFLFVTIFRHQNICTMITTFVVSKCANFEVKMFPNTHFFSKKHEFWRIYQCTDLAEKLQTSTLLLSKRTNRDVFNAIFKSFLRHIESILCLFKVTKKIQKKKNHFF